MEMRGTGGTGVAVVCRWRGRCGADALPMPLEIERDRGELRLSSASRWGRLPCGGRGCRRGGRGRACCVRCDEVLLRWGRVEWRDIPIWLAGAGWVGLRVREDVPEGKLL